MPTSRVRVHDPPKSPEWVRGKILFAIDQQQYLQGYLPIVTLMLYLKAHGNSVSPGQVLDTGPLIVNKNNVSTVQSAINAGQD